MEELTKHFTNKDAQLRFYKKYVFKVIGVQEEAKKVLYKKNQIKSRPRTYLPQQFNIKMESNVVNHVV
jgi:hypothetical protein